MKRLILAVAILTTCNVASAQCESGRCGPVRATVSAAARGVKATFARRPVRRGLARLFGRCG